MPDGDQKSLAVVSRDHHRLVVWGIIVLFITFIWIGGLQWRLQMIETDVRRTQGPLIKDTSERLTDFSQRLSKVEREVKAHTKLETDRRERATKAKTD